MALAKTRFSVFTSTFSSAATAGGVIGGMSPSSGMVRMSLQMSICSTLVPFASLTKSPRSSGSNRTHGRPASAAGAFGAVVAAAPGGGVVGAEVAGVSGTGTGVSGASVGSKVPAGGSEVPAWDGSKVPAGGSQVPAWGSSKVPAWGSKVPAWAGREVPAWGLEPCWWWL